MVDLFSEPINRLPHIIYSCAYRTATSLGPSHTKLHFMGIFGEEFPMVANEKLVLLFSRNAELLEKRLYTSVYSFKICKLFNLLERLGAMSFSHFTNGASLEDLRNNDHINLIAVGYYNLNNDDYLSHIYSEHKQSQSL